RSAPSGASRRSDRRSTFRRWRSRCTGTSASTRTRESPGCAASWSSSTRSSYNWPSPSRFSRPMRLTGVLSPVVTPFKSDLSPDRARYVGHCKWLLANGCSGLAVFGTNSEANSLSVDERMVLLETLVQEGVPPEKLMPGTGCCSLTDSVRLTAHAVALGCSGVLMLPPFYYKGVSDEGLYRNFAEVIERVGDKR